MKNSYIYDVEVYPNLFTVWFVESNANQLILDKAINCDINKDIQGMLKYISKLDSHFFVIGLGHNDLNKLIDFILNKVKILSGFANSTYDNFILNHLLINYTDFKYKSTDYITKELRDLSQLIVHSKDKPRTSVLKYCDKHSWYKAPYISIDLQSLMRLDKKRISLKQVGISLKWYKIQDYIIPKGTEDDIKLYNSLLGLDVSLEYINKLGNFDRLMRKEFITDVMIYNLNDVLLTQCMFNSCKEELRNRYDINKIYHIGVALLSASRSRVADLLLSEFYSQYSKSDFKDFRQKRTNRSIIEVSECLSNKINFTGNVPIQVYEGGMVGTKQEDKYKSLINIKNFNDFVDYLKLFKIKSTKKLNFKIVCNGTGYTMKSGGLHSIDRPCILKSDDKYVYRDSDAASYYPRLVLNEKISPKHLDSKAFLDVAEMVITERIEAKKRKDEHNDFKIKAEALKIVANAGFFGKLNDIYSWTYDLLAFVKVTINGELFLLMLIERLEEKEFDVVSANTDGILTKISLEREQEYFEICNQWERDIGFTLEFNTYKLFIQKDVNSYTAVFDNGKIKRKGRLDFETAIDTGYNAPIIPKAIDEYYINNVPISTTILNHTDIHDFIISQNTGSQFYIEFKGIDKGERYSKILQKNNRYFISTDGGTLMKIYKDGSGQTSLVKGYKVTIFNDYYPVDKFTDYNIDYSYYIAQTNKILDKIEGRLTKDMRTTSGTLFDNLN